MKISVVIPAYNTSATIIDAISSVENQVIEDAVNIEIIIVNDGSSDNLVEVINDYRTSTKYNLHLINKKNGGVSTARNVGIENSEGDWIAFLDADDVWLPNKLQKQVDIIRKKDNVNFIGCARNDEELSILGKKIDSLYLACCNDLLIKMFPQTSTALVRRSVLNTVGNYNETMTHAEDGELWLRICAEGGFYYMPESLVITGGGKENFGASGLSSNLEEMHFGTLKMLNIACENKVISKTSYFVFKAFYYVKYLRRLLLVKMRSA